ncbi:MAG: hypothetical protein PVF17_13775 [Ignavibacteria bacterium]|jgi:hypothetical protein
MKLFNFHDRKPEIIGEIGYFGLSEWWQNEFSDDEREYIVDKYKPLGLGNKSLIEGDIYSTSQSAIGLLSGLASWFNSEKDRTISYRALAKAESLLKDNSDILDVHFLFNCKINIYYRHRNIDSDALDIAMEACRKQIEIAPKAKEAFTNNFKTDSLPSHRGYEQLSIIEEKLGNFENVINISKAALDQGWKGDWEKRIKRSEAKLNIT